VSVDVQLLERARRWLFAPFFAANNAVASDIPRWLTLLLIDSWTSRYVASAIDNDCTELSRCVLINRDQVWTRGMLPVLQPGLSGGIGIGGKAGWGGSLLEMREVSWFLFRQGDDYPALYGLWVGPLSTLSSQNSAASGADVNNAPFSVGRGGRKAWRLLLATCASSSPLS
jgi:hypothetical protein